MNHFTNPFQGSHADHSLKGRALSRGFALFPLMLLMLLLLPTRMVAQTAASSSKYIATYDSSTETLTFRKNVDESLPNNSVWVKDKETVDRMTVELGDISIKHVAFDESFKTFTPTSLDYFFSSLRKLETITGLEYLNTENVTNMSYMFDGCWALTTLNVTNFNTANVTNMSNMFSSCEALTTLDVKNFNTAKVTNMSGMFYNCEALTTLDVTNFNTENVTDMSNMFCYCEALTSLDVTKFNTTNVTDMSFMFNNCINLSSLDITKFNTAKVTNMSEMFNNCYKLSSLDVTNFNTVKVTNMSKMFSGCKALISLDVTKFNTANVTDMSFMFRNCLKLPSLDVTMFNTAKVTTMNYMFDNCQTLTSLDLTNFNTENVTHMNYMFDNCLELTVIFASIKFVTHQVTKSIGMFINCKKLKGDVEWTEDKANDKTYAKIEDGYFTSNNKYACVKYADGTLTFYNNYNETLGENEYKLNSDIKAPEWLTYKDNITNVVFDASFANARPTSCYQWFYKCKKLKQIEGIEYLNTKDVTNMEQMFAYCYALTSLDVTNFNTENVTTMGSMFASCQALTSLDVTNFNTEKVTNMSSMFADCKALTSLDITNFNTAIVKFMFTMFNGCSALTTIYTSDKFVITKDTWNTVMFLDCKKLKGAIEYDEKKTNLNYANYSTGYFTKLVGKNGDEKIGAVGEILTADNLTLADDKDFVAYEPFNAKAASYSRTIKTGTTWGTLCLPFEVSLAEQNFRAFKLLSANEATNTVELEEVNTSIEAGTPVIIKMNNGANSLSFSVDNKEIANKVKTAATTDGYYQLQGLYTQKEFSRDTDNNCYIVKGDKLMNPAKMLENTTIVKKVASNPFRAYMVDNTSSAAGAKMFCIGLSGNSTAIDTLNTIANDKAEYFDLQGKRLNEPQKGINIVKHGNKTMKVIIK